MNDDNGNDADDYTGDDKNDTAVLRSATTQLDRKMLLASHICGPKNWDSQYDGAGFEWLHE
jgi:hypothetical protein